MTPSPTLLVLVTEPDDTPGEPPATFTLRGESALIGRDPHCDLLVVDPSASLRHGLLSPTPQGYRYTDLSSTNGSHLLRADGSTEACPPGLALPLSPGDTLLLGAADRPIRVALAAPTPSPRAAAVISAPLSPLSATRTIVARAPLVALSTAPTTSPTAPAAHSIAALASFAARALTAPSPAALAALVTEALAHYAANAATHGVALWGPAIAATHGAPLPAGLRELALSGRLDAAELAVEGSALPLPQTQSLAQTNTSAALVVPIATPATGPTSVTPGSTITWGVAFATSPLGAEAFPAGVTDAFAVLGPLFALAASTLSRAALSAQAAAAATPPSRPDPAAPLGVSPAFTEAVALARQVAATDVPVLIRGETGSGKEVLARYLHGQSRRQDRPFVAFNCAAIPENLIESELFGHTRGAFTSATSDRKGLFEEAHGGTLFLDEIGEMPLPMQAKLLRVLQDGEVRRVGQNRPTRVDLRVISATHRDLAALASEGRFRADLMYRLNAVTLTLPPLRDRPEDIPLLAHALLARAAQLSHKSFPGFSPDALWALSLHPFPGNVRELDNEIQRAAALTPDGEPICARAFSPALRDRAPRPSPPASPGPAPEPPLQTLREAVSQAERAAIERALSAAQGNISEAARLLEVTRAGLYKAMERLGLK